MEGDDDPFRELVKFLVVRAPPIQIPWLTVAMETTTQVCCTLLSVCVSYLNIFNEAFLHHAGEKNLGLLCLAFVIAVNADVWVP